MLDALDRTIPGWQTLQNEIGNLAGEVVKGNKNRPGGQDPSTLDRARSNMRRAYMDWIDYAHARDDRLFGHRIGDRMLNMQQPVGGLVLE